MWPTFLILALFAFSAFCIVRAVKLMRMTPEERELDRAKYKARADKSAAAFKQTLKGNPKEEAGFAVRMSAQSVDDDAVDGRKYDSLEDWEASLATIWTGNIDVEFTYQPFNRPKERRKVELQEVKESGDARLYLCGHCTTRNDHRHFNVENITTMIKAGSKRFEVYDFMHEKLGLDV